MRIIAAILALLVTPLAHASLVRFDLITDLTGNPSNTWLGEGPAPSTVDLTFTIDTLTAQSLAFTFGNPREPGAPPCVQGFNVEGLAATNINAITNTGSTLWTAQSGTVRVGGDNGGGGCPGGFFGWIGVTDGQTSYGGGQDFGFALSTPAEIFGSSDPLGAYFTSLAWMSGAAGFTGDFGSMYGSVMPGGSIAYVPEPAISTLLLVGLFAIWLRRQRTAQSEFDRMLARRSVQ